MTDLVAGRPRRREPLRARPEPDVDLTDERPRMLVVDDEPDVRDWLRVHFREEGWIVNAARSVAEGLEMARRLRPTLVLLDQRLPDGRGLDVARVLCDELPRMRVILFSAYLDLPAEEEATRLGVQTISKVDRTALFATVAAHKEEAATAPV